MNYLQDDKGNSSSMRLVWAAANIVILGVWAYLCVIRKEFVPWQPGETILMGLLFGGKVGQKYIEKKGGV
jgi:hypothetical protein